ncbi:MAG: NAD-dependent DNA ligase LigA, partial [Hyphomicrobiaceae bacterium]|nr:NAD-dependent DNA ligase LigA [Hyphomicrobiaceae bacterium]
MSDKAADGQVKVGVEELDMKQAKAELAQLSKEINKADQAYYQHDEPLMDDASYDRLRQRLLAIEAKFPKLQRPDSPSFKVGAAPVAGFEKVAHSVPMLSLGNAFLDEDVTEFIERIRRFLGFDEAQELEITSEPKIDGLSISLRYENGRLVGGATRGDGSEGDNVIRNIMTRKEIPKRIEADDFPAV